LSLKYEQQWKTERQERLGACSTLTERMDDSEKHREELVHDYTDRLRGELSALQNDLQQETVDRLYQDEEIVGALNRYTAQLQKSLSFIVSDV
jgi:DNA integrity scanning protein DisA with diadenylate cyclase activity